MRSQVQVLAGPPPNPAGQSAAGSEPGALAAGLGRAGAAPPIPAGTSSGPSGVAHPDVRLGDDHPTWSPPARGRQPRVRCRHLALQPAPMPTAQPPATGAPHAGLACVVAEWASAAAAARTQPGGPGPPRPPSDHRDLASVAASQPLDHRSNHRRPGSHRGLHRFRWSRSPDRLDLSPQRHRLSMGGDGRVRTHGWTADGWTPDSWTPHGWTADGWTPDGWTADGRAPDALDDPR
jgi:hypothetical protein